MEYSLIKDKGIWLIYTPPEFRISKKAITNMYEQWVQSENSIKDKPDTSKEQKEHFKNNSETLEALRKLPE